MSLIGQSADHPRACTALAIGPHPDDIELGCFATLAGYAAHGAAIHMLVMTDGSRGGDPGARRLECLASASLINATVHFGDIYDCGVSDTPETVDIIKAALTKLQPDIVFGPSFKDAHPDHRNTASALLSATRWTSANVLGYQTPSTTLDFVPTCHHDVTPFFDIKLRAVQLHATQSHKPFAATRAMEAVAVYRGLQLGLVDRYFEAFEVVRLVHRWGAGVRQ